MRADLVDSLRALAARAGSEVMALYNQHLERRLPVDQKHDASPVTAADHRAHEIIRAGLTKLQPDRPLLSEEGAQAPWPERRQWREFWLVDPLDGTREFIRQTGEFCICIALVRDGFPVFGLVHAPVSGTAWLGGQGVDAARVERDGRRTPLAVRALPDQAAVVVTSSGGARRTDVRRWIEGLGRHWPGGVATRELGSALKFCAIAAGEAQAYPRFGAIGEWDSAAGQAILEAAGGLVLNREGEPVRYNQGEALVHQHLVAVADRSILDAAGFTPGPAGAA